jgi:molecular chaperone IbpA
MFKQMNFEAIFPKHFVGFEDILSAASKISEDATKGASYPPYNIKKITDEQFVIEIACAGFAESDIKVSTSDNKLFVFGAGKKDESTFIYKGIGMRDFTREFTLADLVEVKSAEMTNGILSIHLLRIVPESKQPKVIPIGKPTKKQFLTED